MMLLLFFPLAMVMLFVLGRVFQVCTAGHAITIFSINILVTLNHLWQMRSLFNTYKTQKDRFRENRDRKIGTAPV